MSDQQTAVAQQGTFALKNLAGRWSRDADPMQSEQFELHAEIEQRHWWFVARRQILRAVIGAVLPPSHQTTIVDVGCGTGANIAALADDYTCIGTDTSPEAIRLAAGRFGRVRFICGEAGKMPEVLASADLVLLTDVLEHVPDDYQLLSELLAPMSPGAYLLATVPADRSLWSEHDRAFGHYRRYERDQFQKLWHDLPVTPLVVSHFNTRLYPIVKTVRWWSQARGKAAGRAGTDFLLPSPPVNRALRRTFAGEGRKLARLARGGRANPYRFGVSLMALLRREDGAIRPRGKPADASADVFDPRTATLAATV